MAAKEAKEWTELNVFWRRSIDCAVGKTLNKFLSLTASPSDPLCVLGCGWGGQSCLTGIASTGPRQAGSTLTFTFSFGPYNRLRRKESRLDKFHFTNEKLRI